MTLLPVVAPPTFPFSVTSVRRSVPAPAFASRRERRPRRCSTSSTETPAVKSPDTSLELTRFSSKSIPWPVFARLVALVIDEPGSPLRLREC